MARSLVFASTALMCLALNAQSLPAAGLDEPLRVCADPDNLPLSNRRGEGYENKLAEALARDLRRSVEYTFFPQRMGFVRNTLKKQDGERRFKCDVIIGVPQGYELTATTRPYMRSTYALVFARGEKFANLDTAQDLLNLPAETLRALRIGVFGYSPGADWLLRHDLLERAVVYSPQSGDPAENPAHTVERDLEAGKIDVAILWGPMAGFLAREHSQWRVAPFAPDPKIKFDFAIAMGVRFGEKAWQSTLDEWIAAHPSRIDAILTGFRIPLLNADGTLRADTRFIAPQ